MPAGRCHVHWLPNITPNVQLLSSWPAFVHVRDGSAPTVMGPLSESCARVLTKMRIGLSRCIKVHIRWHSDHEHVSVAKLSIRKNTTSSSLCTIILPAGITARIKPPKRAQCTTRSTGVLQHSEGKQRIPQPRWPQNGSRTPGQFPKHQDLPHTEFVRACPVKSPTEFAGHCCHASHHSNRKPPISSCQEKLR